MPEWKPGSILAKYCSDSTIPERAILLEYATPNAVSPDASDS